MKIEIKTISQHQVAFIFHKGSYEKIPELLSKVVEWIMAKNLRITMPIYGTYYNSPMEVPPEELEWEVGAGFIGETKAEGDIQIKKIPEHQVVSTIFKGPYGEAASILSDLFEYAAKNGYEIAGPVTEIYLSGPEVPESETLTEVQFPVQK